MFLGFKGRAMRHANSPSSEFGTCTYSHSSPSHPKQNFVFPFASCLDFEEEPCGIHCLRLMDRKPEAWFCISIKPDLMNEMSEHFNKGTRRMANKLPVCGYFLFHPHKCLLCFCFSMRFRVILVPPIPVKYWTLYSPQTPCLKSHKNFLLNSSE